MFFRLQVYERVGISLVGAYDRVGKSLIKVEKLSIFVIDSYLKDSTFKAVKRDTKF